MNDNWRHSGAKVTVYLANHEVLVGWLIYEDATNVVLALDGERHHLRVISRKKLSRLAIDDNRESWIEPPLGVARLKRLRDIAPTLTAEAEPALADVDYRRIKRNAIRFRRIAARAIAGRQDEPIEPRSVPRLGAASISAHDLYESLDLSRDLLEELERTGLLRLLAKYSADLREIVHEETLPAVDAEWAGPGGTDDLLHTAREDHGDVRVTGEVLSEARDRVWTRRNVSRWVDGAGDVVLGGGFASANISLGAIAGVVSSLPTLGIGTVAAVVGIVTSTFTGLSTLKKGLAALIKGD